MVHGILQRATPAEERGLKPLKDGGYLLITLTVVYLLPSGLAPSRLAQRGGSCIRLKF